MYVLERLSRLFDKFIERNERPASSYILERFVELLINGPRLKTYCICIYIYIYILSRWGKELIEMRRGKWDYSLSPFSRTF